MKKFTVNELVKIAAQAVKMLGITIENDHEYGWSLDTDNIYEDGDTRFDYACDGNITIEDMVKWDALRKWVEGEFGQPMTLYIGTRGCYEDRFNVYAIEFTENIEERKAEREREEERRTKKRLDIMVGGVRARAERERKMREEVVSNTNHETTLGDLDALAQLKAMMA